MKTAIIMPTMAETGWDKHLPCLLGQTARPDRIIVIIDRATTAEEQDAFRHAWPDVQFHFNARNLGITPSLNAGIRVAEDADIIFRADDDDESRPDRIEKQLACFAETGADFVTSWGEGVAGDSARRYAIRCPTGDVDIKAALLKRNVLLHPSLAFRRERILALGGYDETYVNAQDYGLYLAGIRAGYSFAAVPEALVTRHYHATNISVKRRMNQLMYSCAARIVHHAATGDRIAFLKTVAHYAILAATPLWLRSFRRTLFSLIGRGA